MVTIQKIIKKAKEYLPELDENNLSRAYDFATEAHSSQRRFSGEPYIIHPLNVADILMEFHPSENMIIAALLHDVAEDTSLTLDDIESRFGREVKELCAGLIKLSKVRSNLDFNDFQIENLRKLFLAMARDYRIVLLKLCDRLHNMMTLDFIKPEKRLRIAQETLNIYSPIAARLGIYRLKSRLEDFCFRHIYPDHFQNLQQQISKTEKWRDKYVDVVCKILIETLAAEGFQAEVEGRVKSAYSIYRKLKKKNKSSIEDIFDVFAMRIVLPDIYKYGKEYTGHLYSVLGILHKNFTPLAQRFKDYVAVPKVNGYRSLHTTLMGLGPSTYTQPTEVQVRTSSMHQTAEFGIAAHWIYKENINMFHLSGNHAQSVDDFLLMQQQNWLTGLKNIGKTTKNNQEFLENLRVDVFQDRIFVLTPRGDVKDLPSGATPIDFAYVVHTSIGNQCIGAKVNGNMVPLDYELKNGEVVEIITRKNARPSQNWLSFVKTHQARNRIHGWFRNLNDEKHLKEGKTILNEKLQQLGKPLLDVNLSILTNYDGKRLPLKERQNLLVEIGKGMLFPSSIIKKIFTLEELLESRQKPVRGLKTLKTTDRPSPAKRDEAKQLMSRPSEASGGTTLSIPKLFIGSEPNMPYHFVKCCNPSLQDELIGYVTRGRGISIHKKSCKVIKGDNDLVRFVSVSKGADKKANYKVYIAVEAQDRVGLIRDITNVIADHGVNIIDFLQKYTEDSYDTLGFLLEVENFDQLDQVLSRVKNVSSVLRAFKVN